MANALFTSKRFENFFENHDKKIKDRMAKGMTTQDMLDRLSSDCDLDLMDHAAYQDCKSRAHLLGKITTDEAQQMYIWLGEIPDTFNSQELAVKVLVTKIIGELLQAGI